MLMNHFPFFPQLNHWRSRELIKETGELMKTRKFMGETEALMGEIVSIHEPFSLLFLILLILSSTF
jgi:hypothetical protein